VSAHDLIVRGARLGWLPGAPVGDVAVADGVFAEVGPEISGDADVTVDGDGLHALPGGVDPHVHLNEPGRTEWEGIATGTAALAVGGVTCAIDMPLNSSPPVLDGASFDAKAAAVGGVARVDLALWGGLVPGDVDRLDELAARGVVGFKAFMSYGGLDDFPPVDDLTLYEGMARAASLGLPVAVHAESDAITAGLAARARAAGRVGVRDYLASRPIVAETEAISRALHLAAETGCAVHVVHVSTGRGVALVTEARARGVDATCEVCPHHLVLDGEDAERLGAIAKCAPPLRPRAECDALWAALAAGDVAMVSSDHSPSPPSLKEGTDFFAIWGGIAGAQSSLELLVSEGVHRGRLALQGLGEQFAAAAARRFALPGKGVVAPGADADLVLLDLDSVRVLQASELRSRHPISPYVGREIRGRVVRTILRGRTVALNGEVVGAARGRLLLAGTGDG
jgi:allantoinase